MMKKLFYNDSVLMQYERNEQWHETITYLCTLYRKRPSQKSVFLRLAAQCWYILTFWECTMPIEKMNRGFYEIKFKELYDIARSQYWHDSDCLWLFGYFMCINQTDFYFINQGIQELAADGERLICASCAMDEGNELAEILCLATESTKRRYKVACKKLKPFLKLYFPSASAVDEYFYQILSGTHGMN